MMEKIEIILANGDVVNARIMFKRIRTATGTMYVPNTKAGVILGELLKKLDANDWRRVGK